MPPVYVRLLLVMYEKQKVNVRYLSFSTHPDSRRSKTKGIAYTKEEKTLQTIVLGGCELPWVSHAKHLGHKISFKINGLSEDSMEKSYINRVNEFNQEFYSNSSTKIMINNIFNSRFYGSQIWDLFSDEAIRLEKLWNISLRILLGIPRNTHRYFIEPLSGTTHIMLSLFKRFLNFINLIKNSLKGILNNCQSTTGCNLRKLLLLTEKKHIEGPMI